MSFISKGLGDNTSVMCDVKEINRKLCIYWEWWRYKGEIALNHRNKNDLGKEKDEIKEKNRKMSPRKRKRRKRKIMEMQDWTSVYPLAHLLTIEVPKHWLSFSRMPERHPISHSVIHAGCSDIWDIYPSSPFAIKSKSLWITRAPFWPRSGAQDRPSCFWIFLTSWR